LKKVTENQSIIIDDVQINEEETNIVEECQIEKEEDQSFLKESSCE
jgi:hypothetical protein